MWFMFISSIFGIYFLSSIFILHIRFHLSFLLCISIRMMIKKDDFVIIFNYFKCIIRYQVRFDRLMTSYARRLMLCWFTYCCSNHQFARKRDRTWNLSIFWMIYNRYKKHFAIILTPSLVMENDIYIDICRTNDA